jgi:hypothetical protein
MMMSTIVAVALGVAPVDENGTVRMISSDYSRKLGRYSQFVDRRGTTFVRGRDTSGRAYDITIDRNGYVEASVGELTITFRAEERV